MSMSFYCWLCDKPLILRYAAPDNRDIGDFLPATRLYRLPMYYWHRSPDQIEHYHVESRRKHPEHVLHHLINERSVWQELTARGVPATFTNHNAFLDERIFNVQKTTGKRYDAVYNARMAPFKRHVLARELRSLLIVGGVHAETDNWDYFEQVRRELPQAHFTHAPHDRWLTANEVAQALNGARVGLCLSACEGTMYAATEYLLCGLPVVSTPSLGGRDEWFDTRFVRIVPDDATAIAEAVRELISLNLSPHLIRQEALRRVVEHRRRFFDLVQSIYDREQVGRDYARDWYSGFFHKMAHWRDVSAVMEFLHADCPARVEDAVRVPNADRAKGIGSLDRIAGILDELANLRDGNMDQHRWVHLFRLLGEVIVGEIPGDVVELGCYRGNTAVYFQKVLDALGSPKRLHLYDSFQGLPQQRPEDQEAAAFLKPGALSCTPADVARTFAARGARPPEVHAGWFRDSLPRDLPATIAFAHLDGDMYDSMLVSLEHVYPRLSQGAVAVIDDYSWSGTPGVKKACDRFFATKPETVSALPGTTQGYIRKSA